MATLREIRTRISSIKNTQQITKAMKMVAAAKLRKAQENILAYRPYAYEIRDLLSHLTAVSEDLSDIQLMQQRPVERVLSVVVTADRGLCGAFNSNIIRKAAKRPDDFPDKEVALYPVGRKGFDFFKRRDVSLKSHKINFFNDLSFEDAIEISRNLVSWYKSGLFDRIEFIYNEFKSAVQQNIIVEQFLPFVPEPEIQQNEQLVDFLYEPDKLTIINELIPLNLNVQVWRILLESNAAEQGARMTAMESATDNAAELIDTLTIYYNRSRQAAITKEISEIVGGAEALKQN
ncbi:MAG: ATP synthase F1 subunit gamma [Caldithrix sp.]|nr:ATP synthase F1 subunit gamma [Caldithrix sp.]